MRFGTCLVLAVACAALFLPSLSGGLVYDDLLLVDANPATRSIGAALGSWMEPFWAFDQADSLVQRGLWRPVTTLLLSVGRLVGGGDTFGYHLVSLLLHIAATWATFALACRVLRGRGFGASRAFYGGAAAALLFAVHPAHVESVAWISSVNDPAWGLLALLALLRHETRAQAGRSSRLAPVLALLALMTKEHAVVILPLALALDLSAGRRPRPTAALGFLLAYAIWFGLRVAVFSEAGAGLLREHGDFGITMARQFSLRLELLGGFLAHTFWPADPAVFRAVHPELPEGSTAVRDALLWTLGTIALLVLSIRGRRRAVALGLGAVLITVLPIVATPDRAGLFPLSDRYLYAAVPMAAIAVAAGLARIQSLVPLGLVPLGLVTVAAAGLMARVGLAHSERFESDLTFRKAAVLDAPDSPNVLWGAGRVFIQEYERTQDTDALNRAYFYYLSSLRAGTIYGDGSFEDDPRAPWAERIARIEKLIIETPAEQRRQDTSVLVTFDDRYQATLGQIYCNLLSIDLAKEPDYDYPLQLASQAERLWPDRAELSSVRADIHMKRGEIDEAKAAVGRALQRAPGNAGMLYQLGQILSAEGDVEGARRSYAKAVELDPTNVEARFSHALSAFRGQRDEIAARELEVIHAATGRGHVQALVLNAQLERRRSQPGAALRWLDRAIELDPGNGFAFLEQGYAMVQLGDVDGAIEGFSKAAELMPDDFQSHYNYAALMLDQRPPESAGEGALREWRDNVVLPALVRAYMLSPRTGQEQLLLQAQIDDLVGANPDTAFNIATALLRQGRDALALFWLQRVIEHRDIWPADERDANLAAAYRTMGQLYVKAGQIPDATDALRNSVLTDPSNFQSRYDLGDLLYRSRDLDGAEPHLRAAQGLFASAKIAPEFRNAVKGTLESMLRDIELSRSAGPQPAPAGTSSGGQ